MITFRKKDDVYLEVVEGERSELRMLSDYFTFKVPGAEFSPQYRNKFWDGKVRLFDSRNLTIYAGLWKDIIKFSKDFDVDVLFEGTKHNFPGREQPVDENFIKGFIEALNVQSGGKPIEPRDYQVEAFIDALRRQRMLVLSPTASGKSLIIYMLIRWWREIHDRKILIIVPTISLVSQLIADFSDYSGGSFNDVAGITGGQTRDPDSRVVVSTWQSIHKQPLKWFAQFGSVIVDEVHHAQAKSIQSIMKKLIVCPDRIGFTGTLQDTKTHELVLKGLFGPIKKVITTKELMDRDQIAQMSIRMLQLKYNEDNCKLVSKMKYQEEVEFICNNEQRNNYISKMASTLKGNTLVVFSRLDHGKALFEAIETDKQNYYIAGETDKDQREVVRQLAENNDVVIVASLGVFSTGVNIKNLYNLIFAHPTKSKIKTLQSVGRILRKTDDEKQAVVYDIIDDLKYKSRDNFALKHAKERYKYYTQENFNIKHFEIEIK